jgi:hypothetical protein
MGIDIAAERKRKAAEQLNAAQKTKKRTISQAIEDFSMTPPAVPTYKFICTQCGTPGKPKTITKGNILVELVLWIFGIAFIWFFGISIIMAIIYSAWRHLSRFKGCRECHGPMIKLDTPMGQKLMQSLGA